MKTLRFVLGLAVLALVAATGPAMADTLQWKGPTHTLTIGLSEEDISHIEFPEDIINITVENPEYVDILVVEGYGNRAFRMRSLLPKMATRIFFTGNSSRTYIVVVTTDVPYRSYVQIVDGTRLNAIGQALSQKFGPNELIRAMAMDKEIPGVLRETHVIPNWFSGSGLTFELSEIWQTPLLTGLVVHVQNQFPTANEVNMPAITIPKTSEWGVLRSAAMENMRLAPRGMPNDKGVLFLVFSR
jgi:hypothetical protein